MKPYGGMESGPGTNRSDFGGDAVEVPDPRFVNPARDRFFNSFAILDGLC